MPVPTSDLLGLDISGICTQGIATYNNYAHYIWRPHQPQNTKKAQRQYVGFRCESSNKSNRGKGKITKKATSKRKGDSDSPVEKL
jgi:hypothetical protein